MQINEAAFEAHIEQELVTARGSIVYLPIYHVMLIGEQ